MSMAGIKVCLIEKGRRWEAQDFPTDSFKIMSAARIENRNLGISFGPKDALFQGQFDDVQKAPSLPSKAPKEFKELDDNKSKKGLAKVYEEEYVQKTGLVSAALSFSDEQKKEASVLFKKLCLKLDALSHFHFAPKPVIEDMSIQANVPALAMEEHVSLNQNGKVFRGNCPGKGKMTRRVNSFFCCITGVVMEN